MKQIPNKLHHQIIPGILEKGWDGIEEKLEIIKPFTNTVHIDLLDGKFAENTSFFDPKPFAKYANDFFFEIHMMVDNPIQFLKPWADIGAKRFIGHVEKMPDIAEFVAEGELLGEVGLGIDSPTDITALNVPFEDLDAVLVMTVKAGFSNQNFLPDMLTKVEKLRNEWPSLPIEVDGGINDKTVEQALKKGATRFVSTGFLFHQGQPQTQYHTLSHLIEALV